MAAFLRQKTHHGLRLVGGNLHARLPGTRKISADKWCKLVTAGTAIAPVAWRWLGRAVAETLAESRRFATVWALVASKCTQLRFSGLGSPHYGLSLSRLSSGRFQTVSKPFQAVSNQPTSQPTSQTNQPSNHRHATGPYQVPVLGLWINRRAHSLKKMKHT